MIIRTVMLWGLFGNIILSLMIFSAFTTDEFCDGWEFGYEQGWCYDQVGECITPILPLCPIPEIYRDTYQDGYNRGFIKGREDKN